MNPSSEFRCPWYLYRTTGIGRWGDYNRPGGLCNGVYHHSSGIAAAQMSTLHQQRYTKYNCDLLFALWLSPTGPKLPGDTAEVAERLASFIDTWKVLIGDTWVLNTIVGFQIPFKGQPFQAQRHILSVEQVTLLQDKVRSLLQKGAISSLADSPEGFYSTLPEKGGQMRPVINLKCLNQWVEDPHFKIKGIATLKDHLKPGDWMVKVVMKDAYFTIKFTHTINSI